MLIGSVLSPNANNSLLCVLIVLRAFLVGHGTMIFVLSIAGGTLALILMMSLALIF